MIIEASKKKRLLNFIFDLITIGILMEITFQLEALVENKTPLKVLRVIIVFGGYYIPMEYFLGKTLGKFLTKTRVVNEEGEKIDFRQAVMRFLCRWIPFEFLSLGLGHDAKAWHDLLTKTHVIDEEKQAELSDKISELG
ncbi:MAG: RDD family protein [Bacteroidia bacterium]|nr:RDD family protein [Bacteroidia bacterium]